MAFNFVSYFRNVAIHLKDIAHTDAVPKFHRVSGLTTLEELLQNMIVTNESGYQLVVEDNHDSSLYYNSETLLDNQYYVFYILKHVDLNDFDKLEFAKEGAKAVSQKIYGKMFMDSYNDSIPAPVNTRTGLRVLDKGSISTQTVGPLADQYWGVMCSFTISDNPGIKYNPDDWMP